MHIAHLRGNFDDSSSLATLPTIQTPIVKILKSGISSTVGSLPLLQPLLQPGALDPIFLLAMKLKVNLMRTRMSKQAKKLEGTLQFHQEVYR